MMHEHTATRSATRPLDVRRVVVPLDGTALGSAALPTAEAVAARLGAELVAATGAPTRAGPGSLVVRSTRARGRLHGALAGSDVDDLLAAGEPFVAVGPNADRPGWLVGRPRRRPRSWPEPLSRGDVVVLVDGTPEAERAVPVAARWAAALDRDLVVLATATATGPDAIVERARATTPRVSGAVLVDPLGVVAGIRRHLADHRVALLVVAASNRRGRERLRRGATAAGIVRVATVPVLVVPVSRRGDPSDREVLTGPTDATHRAVVPRGSL